MRIYCLSSAAPEAIYVVGHNLYCDFFRLGQLKESTDD